MTKHKSEDYKLSAVKYFLENKDTRENTCRIFKCSVRSLLRWTKSYEQENEIKRHNRKPISYKVKKKHIKFILEELKNNKTITIEDLLTKLSNKYSKLNITRRHISRIIKENYISLKLTKIRHDAVRATSYIKYTIYLVSNIHKKYIFAICSGITIIKHNNYNNLDNLINNNIINHNHFSHQQWGEETAGETAPNAVLEKAKQRAIERPACYLL